MFSLHKLRGHRTQPHSLLYKSDIPLPSFGSMASLWLAWSQPKFVVWRFRIGLREEHGTRVEGGLAGLWETGFPGAALSLTCSMSSTHVTLWAFAHFYGKEFGLGFSWWMEATVLESREGRKGEGRQGPLSIAIPLPWKSCLSASAS